MQIIETTNVELKGPGIEFTTITFLLTLSQDNDEKGFCSFQELNK